MTLDKQIRAIHGERHYYTKICAYNDHVKALDYAMESLEKLKELQSRWSAYTDFLKEKYPPPHGQEFQFTCEHHLRIDQILHDSKGST